VLYVFVVLEVGTRLILHWNMNRSSDGGLDYSAVPDGRARRSVRLTLTEQVLGGGLHTWPQHRRHDSEGVANDARKRAHGEPKTSLTYLAAQQEAARENALVQQLYSAGRFGDPRP
jgi:hypothetical protein